MGNSVGKTIPLYPPIKEIYLELHWRDLGTTCKRFENVQELAEFLKNNPVLGQAVGYGIKKELTNKTLASLTLPMNLYALPQEAQKLWLDSARELIEKHSGKVEIGGRAFTSYSLLEKYLGEYSKYR